MIKEKPCKGTGQAHGFGCGKMVNAVTRKYGLGLSCCYPAWLFDSDAGRVKLNKALNKAQKPRLELEKAKEQRDTSTSLKNALKTTKTAVHEYIRLRDKGKPCISCGEPWRVDFQAGHYHKAELFETLRFHLHNINGQCMGCNLYKDGNLENYNINLPLRIGQEAFNDLQKLARFDKHLSKVWDLESLSKIRIEVKGLKQKLTNAGS